jgi:hypothetical protein
MSNWMEIASLLAGTIDLVSAILVLAQTIRKYRDSSRNG